MEIVAYFLLYLALITWISLLPILKTRPYDPPYFWRWTILVLSSGPILSLLTMIGFWLIVQEGHLFDLFMGTGLFILLLIVPFQLLVPMTVYMFICASLKDRRDGSDEPPAYTQVPEEWHNGPK
jgi:hypothetical protein